MAGSLGEPAVAPPLSSLIIDRLSFATRARQTALMQASSLSGRATPLLGKHIFLDRAQSPILLRDMSSCAAQERRCTRGSNWQRGHVQSSGQGMATSGLCPLVRTSGGHAAQSDPAARHMSGGCFSGRSMSGGCFSGRSMSGGWFSGRSMSGGWFSWRGTRPLVRVRAGHPLAGVRAGQVRKTVKRVNQRGRERQGKLPSSPGSVRRPPHAWLLDFRPR
ncbi:hypothetical protein SAMN04487915_101964 [Arthrobacter sp. ov118]|nr:hypothetical protein SAMN04487915_101964 [Arthrobacter sp. ov118]